MRYDTVVVDSSIQFYTHWWHCRELAIQRAGELIHTGLEFGFLKCLLSLARNYYPARIYLTWDGEPKRVVAIYPEYKAGRDKSNQEKEQPWGPRINRMREILSPLVSSYYHPEMEADELIALFVHQQEALGKKTLIYSSDADMYQLLSDQTHQAPNSDTIITPADIQEKWGIPVHKVPLYRAICGDRSDKIPGVPRIPEKIKGLLVNQANNLDHLIELFHSAPYLSASQKEKLIENAELVRRNYLIMNMRDLKGEPAQPIPCIGNIKPVQDLCKELELTSLDTRKEWGLFQTVPT